MIQFFKGAQTKIFVVGTNKQITSTNIEKLCWLFGNAESISQEKLTANFIGPRKEMITPWSTNAVEITQNMGIEGIERIEEFFEVKNEDTSFDPMLQATYNGIDQTIFTIEKQPEPILHIDDIAAYNQQEGLALNDDEVAYLNGVSKKIGRKLTDSEVFGFSQVNSEHCRHKIFNGEFIIDGESKSDSLFQMIRKTAAVTPDNLVSAYKDNVAFIKGFKSEQFAPKSQDKADFFEISDFDSVISIKAETHNFPTTVEPFNGAATGSGGEIRDRMAGGTGSVPLAGSAVYMTSYSRLNSSQTERYGERNWEKATKPRNWLYQTPIEILIKASNGASDFGNKFGQPLINGSVLTFEHFENDKKYGYDKVIMLAGGIGYGKLENSKKQVPEKGDQIVVMGGDNYRIGMGGSAVSSVATGEFNNSIELNAVQRSNPEMQKRVANVIRALSEMGKNPIVSIHDHGAGGHLNCLSELVEETGGTIDVRKLPTGDPTLSAKEIVGNESQERMGLVIKKEDLDLLKRISERERAPFYVVGETTNDLNFKFVDSKTGLNPIDWKLEHMFGKPPKTVLKDSTIKASFDDLAYDATNILQYLKQVLQLEAVACKDWLTNKVDRCVTGKVAKQQTVGELQLPLNNLGVAAIDFSSNKGIATAIGHAPVSALIDPEAGSRLSIAEALTNIIWAPIEGGLKNVSLSANWMWPAKNKGEDARLYEAVKAVSDFACELGINIPTGKDSLSMVQKYPNGDTVYAPGTVIISAYGGVSDVNKIIEPVIHNLLDNHLIYIDLSNDNFKLGGSSFSQALNKLGVDTPTVTDAKYFASAFNTAQKLINKNLVSAGHDISAGGMITALLEMTFANTAGGLTIDISNFEERDLVKILFSENPGIIIQTPQLETVENILNTANVNFKIIGKPIAERALKLKHHAGDLVFDIDHLRDVWMQTSHLLDKQQSEEAHANKRFENYKVQPLKFDFPKHFTGKFQQYGLEPKRREKSGIKAAIIREKGINSDREMAYAMYLAGFDVKDIHMTDLISGREDLSDVNFIVFTGGFSNSDVLGSAKGWAGAFLYNNKAKAALDNFYAREDTLSLGVCNGCQLMMELGLIFPDMKMDDHPKMAHNTSGKFECSFVNMDIPENNSVLLYSMAGSRLGIWIAHGEGRFKLEGTAHDYHISGKYSYGAYPANPNGSDFNVASLHSKDGRHLAIMPHLERSLFPWNWANYPKNRKNDKVSPWMEAFMNAKNWVEKKV